MMRRSRQCGWHSNLPAPASVLRHVQGVLDAYFLKARGASESERDRDACSTTCSRGGQPASSVAGGRESLFSAICWWEAEQSSAETERRWGSRHRQAETLKRRHSRSRTRRNKEQGRSQPKGNNLSFVDEAYNWHTISGHVSDFPPGRGNTSSVFQVACLSLPLMCAHKRRSLNSDGREGWAHRAEGLSTLLQKH